ncbi:condensation domain-containing protein [Streptomyces sp. NPDC021098]|uniref:condensation domain-containing protein n=1 Tax=unclassified Streptomyces TaxID=2593676 RepID=UPI0037BE1B61
MDVIRSGPVGWAQHWYWLLDSEPVRGDGPLDAYAKRIAVPAGATVDEVRHALRTVLERYEALRTTYDSDASGAPRQLVHAECAPQLIVVPADGTGDDVSPLERSVPTTGVFERSSCFAVVGVAEERVTDLLVVFRQISVDGVAIEKVRDDLELLLREPGTPLPAGGPGPHPLDHAEWENAAEQQKANRRALAYWQQQLRRGPHASIPFSWPAPDGSVSYETTVVSQRGAELCARIAQTCQVTGPTVVQGVLALLVAGWTEHDVCVMTSVFANRWNKTTQDSVCRLAGGGRIVFDLPRDLTARKALRTCHLSLLEMYMNARYHVGDLVMRESREALRRGARIQPGIMFEYHYANKEPLFADRSAEPERVARTRMDYRVAGMLVDASLSDRGLEIAVRAPTEVMPESSGVPWVETFLRLMSRIAEDPDARVGELVSCVELDAPWKQRGWVSLDNAWVHLDKIAALLTEHPSIAEAEVFTTPQEDTTELVARVVAKSPDLTEQDIAEYLRDVAGDFPSTVQPHRYVVAHTGTAAAPRENTESAAEKALREAFEAIYPEVALKTSRTYAENGGEFLRIPSVLAEVWKRGYSGLRYADFVGTAPLRRLALKMTRAAA